MAFPLCDSKSFSEMNFITDLFVIKEDYMIKVQLPQEAFMSVLKMD